MLKAVIFDMDGVLIDSEPLHYEANVNVLAKYGVTLDYPYYKQYIGTTNTYMWQKIRDDFNLPVTPQQLNDEGAKEKERLVSEKGYEPVAGAIELVHHLHAHNIRMAVASSSPFANIQNVLKGLGIGAYFDVVVSGEQVTNPKPAPDVFLEAVAQLQLTPSDCIVIEDSHNGVMAATYAAICCLGYLNPNSGTQDLSQASYLAESLEGIDLNFLQMVHAHSNHLPWTVFTTDRCIVREISTDDMDALYELYNHPDMTQYMEGLLKNREDELEFTRAYIENMYYFYGYGLWVIIDKQTGQLIGRAGLSHREVDGVTEAELGYCIRHDYQKQGIAYEVCNNIIQLAQNQFEITHLNIFTRPENTASIRLAEKLGFEYTQTYRCNRTDYARYELNI